MNRVIERYFSRFLDIVRGEGGEITEILGDGLLALFEGPRLAENVSQAVSVALGMQRAAAELNASEARRHDPIVMNVGVNAGPALVGMTLLRGRLGERSVYSATGPIVNVAARLCGLATGGQVLVSAEVARMLRNAYRTRRLGRRRLKNVGAPVEVYKVVTASSAPNLTRSSTAGSRRSRASS